MRFSGLSSTIKIFACGATNDLLFRSSVSFHSTFEIFPSDTFFIGSCTKKLLPLPYTLSTQIIPSICSASCFAIASPNPVPLIFLFFLESTLINASNKTGKFSSLIPIPVSFTSKISFVSSSFLLTLISIWPSLVYFTALLIRFKRICLICITSPIRYAGKVLSNIRFIFNDFCSACFSAINITSSSSCLSSYFPSSISIFPDSILEISKILLINEIR